MKFQVKRSELLHAVTVCAAVIKKGDQRKPSLRLCLRVTKEQLIVQGRNGLKISRFRLGHSQGEEIKPTCLEVDERKLLQALKVTNGDTVTLEVKSHVLNVCGTNARKQELIVSLCLLSTLEELHEPALTGGSFHQLVVSREMLIKGLSAVRFCCDCDATRYCLSAVVVASQKGSNQIEFAATDSRRLAVSLQDLIFGKAPATDHTSLWNCYFVDQLLLVLRNSATESVLIHSWGTQAFSVIVGGCEMHDYCVEGRYPRYRDVYPKTLANPSTFHVADLRAAIAACRVTTSKEELWLSCTLQSDGLAITSACNAVGETRVKVSSLLIGEIPQYTFLLDHRFLDQFLSTLPKSGMVEFHLPEAEGCAFHLKAEGYIDYIQMPIDRQDTKKG